MWAEKVVGALINYSAMTGMLLLYLSIQKLSPNLLLLSIYGLFESDGPDSGSKLL